MGSNPDIEIISVELYEAYVSKGVFGTPADTIGYYTDEEKAREAARLNTKLGHSLGEFHAVKGVKLGGRYYVGRMQLVEVNQPPQVVHPRESFLSRLFGGKDGKRNT